VLRDVQRPVYGRTATAPDAATDAQLEALLHSSDTWTVGG
jgi:hypothetical protein